MYPGASADKYENIFREYLAHNKKFVAVFDADGNISRGGKGAKKRYIEEKRTGDGFDRVFCVFDKDSHESYEEALRLHSDMKPKGVFKAIVSVPCFEYPPVSG